MTTMYCPRCGMDVFTVRQDIDVFLFVILCIFTAGIGAIIYLAIYLDKDSNRCIHCKSICQPIGIESTPQNPISLQFNSSNNTNTALLTQKVVATEVNVKYCFNCGTELDERQELNFCSYCGAKIK